ncbi:MAG: peptidase S41, partial [Candidatus Aminicenantes bacterium]
WFEFFASVCYYKQRMCWLNCGGKTFIDKYKIKKRRKRMSDLGLDFKEVGLDAGSLQDFLAGIKELDLKERDPLVDQALVLMEDIYVHLPLKRAMHAVDPIQRLKLLKYRNARLSERAFHDEMISIFMGLRDLHTNYMLPDPYQKMRVFLPFLIEEFYEGNRRKFMVSKVSPDFSHPTFKQGVLVTHWNGIPIERAVELNGNRFAGSNEDARHARGVERMTIRPLIVMLPPDEEWVDITYLVGDQVHQHRFKWQVTPPPPVSVGSDIESADERVQCALGIDIETEEVRRMKKAIFSKKAMKIEKTMAKYHPQYKGKQDKAPDLGNTSLLPDIFAFRTVNTSHGEFGYIRIYTFKANDEDIFVKEFVRIAEMMPKKGLILDVRGNGGGVIMAGEKLLQVLTPKKIEPERLSFVTTPLMHELCSKYDWLSQWVPSIERAIETGAVFSQGFPFLPVEEYNRIGQKYFGPVILITDALCYSTTDIFAAGFQDHEIGPILGVHKNTGAGGANVWTHSLLKRLLPSSTAMLSLPKNASFRVSIRRTTRVGKNIGMPLEDLGVVPDHIHYMTKNDLLDKNVDLIEKAASILAG